MITTTHMLISAMATTRPRMRGWMITLGWLGGLVPDLSMFAMVGMSRFMMEEGVSLWRQPDGLYWNAPWRPMSDLLHSMPIWGLLALIGWLVWRRSSGRWAIAGQALLVVSAGAFLHALGDFFTHTDDAHAHFVPLTDWRFSSPVSYYRSSHFGREFSMVELVFVAFAVWWMFTRFKQWSVRIITILVTLPFLMRLGVMFYRWADFGG